MQVKKAVKKNFIKNATMGGGYKHAMIASIALKIVVIIQLLVLLILLIIDLTMSFKSSENIFPSHHKTLEKPILKNIERTLPKKPTV
jgi:hypothetical protein